MRFYIYFILARISLLGFSFPSEISQKLKSYCSKDPNVFWHIHKHEVEIEINHQYVARENKMLQEIIDKIIQKVDFTRDQLLDGIKTLGSNYLHIAKTIDVLEKGIIDNSKWIGKVHSVTDKT